MLEENLSQEFRLKNIDETRNYFIEEKNRNESMNKKREKVCKTLNNIKHFPVLGFAVTGSVSISAFASLVAIPIRITSSAVGRTICAITAGIKKFKSIFKKKKKKRDKTVLLARPKLNTKEVLFSGTLTDSYISHDKFVSVKNVLEEYVDMKEKIKISNNR